jgi:hypothetical protein
MERDPDKSTGSTSSFGGIDNVADFITNVTTNIIEPLLHSTPSYDLVHHLVFLSKAVQHNLLNPPYNVKHADELPISLAHLFGRLFKVLAKSFGRLPLTERVFCMLVDSSLGASICLQHNILASLTDVIMGNCPDTASSGLFSLCCLLHSPSTRDAFVTAIAQSPLLPRLIHVLHDYTAQPNWTTYNHASLLALNWVGGGAVGSRVLIPYVPDLLAALNAEGETPRVTLLLSLANLPAYLDDDANGVLALRQHGLVAPLLESVHGKNIAQGCVGALMGLLNLHAHLGDAPELELDQDMVNMLAACLQCALRSESQDNIL